MINLIVILIIIYLFRNKISILIFDIIENEHKQRLLFEINEYLNFFEPIYLKWFEVYYKVINDNYYIYFDTNTDSHHTKTLKHFPHNYSGLFIKRRYHFNDNFSGCIIVSLKLLKHFNRKQLFIFTKDKEKKICIPPFIFEEHYHYFDTSIHSIIENKAIYNYSFYQLRRSDIEELIYILNNLKMLYSFCKSHKIE